MVDVAAHLDTDSTVGVLTRLDNPHACPVLGVLYQIFVGLWVLEDFEEFLEFSVGFTLFNVECEGHVIEWILSKGFIVNLHVIPNSLLVAQMEVVVLMVRGHHAVVSVVLLFLVFVVIILVLVSNASFSCYFLTTSRNAGVSFLETCHLLLFTPFRCRYQIFNRGVAFLVGWLRRHETF